MNTQTLFSQLQFITTFLLLTISINTWSDVYTWKDENGKAHFSDKPPKNKQVKEVISKKLNIVDDNHSLTSKKEPKETSAKGVIDVARLQRKNGIFYEVNADKPYTGSATQLYGDGTKRIEMTLVHGMGSAMNFDENGYLISETSFNALEKTTKTIERDKSGNIIKEVTRKITHDRNHKVIRNEVIKVNIINFKSASSLKNIINGVQIAYYKFIDRYRQMPGDWFKDKAAEKIPGVTTGGNGDGRINDGGNGIWEEALGVWEHLSKSGLFWEHLETSGIENVIYTGGNTQPNQKNMDEAPRNPFGGFMMLLRSKDYSDQWGSKERMLFVIGDGIPVTILAELDVLLDDGAPESGIVRLGIISGGILGTISNSSSDCVTKTNSMAAYNTTNTEALCNGVVIY